MARLLTLSLAVVCLCAWADAQGSTKALQVARGDRAVGRGEPGRLPGTRSPRFEPVDVYVDSGAAPLAAYQFELKATAGRPSTSSGRAEPVEARVAIVGLEGGEHPAFKEAPYYDPAALMKDRVVVAAFSTARDLPHGRTRIARLHMQVTGDEKPAYTVKLVVAASADGKQIPATLSIDKGEKP